MKILFTKEKLKLVMRCAAYYLGIGILFFGVVMGVSHFMMESKNDALNQMKLIAQNPVPYAPQEALLLNQFLQSPKMYMMVYICCFGAFALFFIFLLTGLWTRKHLSKYPKKKQYDYLLWVVLLFIMGMCVVYIPFFMIHPIYKKQMNHSQKTVQFFQQAATREELNLCWIERTKMIQTTTQELEEFQQRWDFIQENEELRNEAMIFLNARTSELHANFISRIDKIIEVNRWFFIEQWEMYGFCYLVWFLAGGILIFRAAGAHPNNGKFKNHMEKKT